MRHSKSLVLLASISALMMPTMAGAQPSAAGSGGKSDSNYCWGVVSSQLAHVEGGLGDHIKEQSEPRLGLGNVAQLFYDMGLISSPTVSALGSFLASIDEYDQTSCPVES